MTVAVLFAWNAAIGGGARQFRRVSERTDDARRRLADDDGRQVRATRNVVLLHARAKLGQHGAAESVPRETVGREIR